MYPVDKRDAQTLVPLFEKNVGPRSRILSDSWTAYLHVNELGYEHCSVTHKTTFKQSYRNVQTGEIVCTTNIFGAWKISREHFRELMGQLQQILRNIYLKFFEGTMCIIKIYMLNFSN